MEEGSGLMKQCQFPFIYDLSDDIPYFPATIFRWFTKETTFDTCTDYKRTGRPWCATKVTSTHRYIPGHWGECKDTLTCKGKIFI